MIARESRGRKRDRGAGRPEYAPNLNYASTQNDRSVRVHENGV